MISLQSMIDDNTNLIEIYIANAIADKNVIDIGLHSEYIEKILESLPVKHSKTTDFTTYSRNALVYVYDMSNDSQMVHSKQLIKNLIIKPHSSSTMNLYVASYKNSKLPTHLFPCLSDIDDKSEFKLSEYKLSNRVSLIIKTDQYGSYVYIEYRHSPQVEIEKVESTINNLIKTILKKD